MIVTRALLLVVVHASVAQEAWAQTRSAPVFDISVRLSVAPVLEVEGQVTVPGRARSVDSVELQTDRRITDLR